MVTASRGWKYFLAGSFPGRAAASGQMVLPYAARAGEQQVEETSAPVPTPTQSKMAVKFFTEAFLLLWFGVVGMGPCSQAGRAGTEMGTSSAAQLTARSSALCCGGELGGVASR